MDTPIDGQHGFQVFAVRVALVLLTTSIQEHTLLRRRDADTYR